MDKANLCIIGSGLASYNLAKQWRQKEPDGQLTIVTANQGCFYSKPLLSTALSSGALPNDLIFHDASAMAKQLHANILTETHVSDIDVHAKQVICEHGESFAYQNLLLALGAMPRVIPLEGDATSAVIYINQWEDYCAFRSRLAPFQSAHVIILGAGLVGCEFANDLTCAGHKVSIIAPDAWPLEKLLPQSCGKALQSALSKQGVNWHLSSSIASVDYAEKSLKVTDQHGKSYTGDLVLSAAGIAPCTALAQKAGLCVIEGIVVDQYSATSSPNIYALGDCAQFDGEIQPYVAPIMHGARALAATLTGNPTAVSYPVMPIVLKTSCMPTMIFKRPSTSVASWSAVFQDKTGLRAEGFDSENKLSTVVLMGSQITQRQAVLKSLSQS